MADPRVTSLNHRLRNRALAARIAPERLRNRLVFQRILARLAADSRWVLKGGFALEARLGLDARATKDLDLLRWGEASPPAAIVQELLDEALDVDLGDGFSFVVRVPRPVRVEEALPSTWRVVVDAHAFGSRFAEVVVDIVTHAEAPVEGTELLQLGGVLDEAVVQVTTLDVNRQAAEKFHAYSRIYAHDRPSSRVKDLVDLALLAEAGVLDVRFLGVALRQVFVERDAAEPPQELPRPPRDWDAPFVRLARDTGLSIANSAEAWQLARTIYRTALDSTESP